MPGRLDQAGNVVLAHLGDPGTAGPQFFVQVPLAVASGEDWSVLAWSDTRHGNKENSTQDIAAAVVDFAHTEPGGTRGA